MDRLSVTSTSAHSAICSDIVIRQSEIVRLVFRPEIVDNPRDPRACIRGTFIYQKKGKGSDWDDVRFTSLATLKKGEGYQLEIKSGELLPLLLQLGALYRLHRRQGVPQGRHQFVRLEENLAQFLQLGEGDLHAFLDTHSNDAIQTLHKVLRWLASSTALANFIVADTDQIAILNAVLGVASIRAVRAVWESNRSNGDEQFWQQTLSEHAFVFSQLLAYPILVIRGKAYVGGKRLDNRHGNVVDFLARAKTSGNALLIEIKTPQTPLLAAEYRDEAYPLSAEVTGALAQILQYKDSLTQDLRRISEPGSEQFLLTEPRSLLVVGNAEAELTSVAKRLSFERFRERLTGVTLVTFDEIFGRVAQLEQLLTPPPEAHGP